MRLLLWVLISLHLLGCSEGIFSDDDKATVAESAEEYRAPTITIIVDLRINETLQIGAVENSAYRTWGAKVSVYFLSLL